MKERKKEDGGREGVENWKLVQHLPFLSFCTATDFGARHHNNGRSMTSTLWMVCNSITSILRFPLDLRGEYEWTCGGLLEWLLYDSNSATAIFNWLETCSLIENFLVYRETPSALHLESQELNGHSAQRCRWSSLVTSSVHHLVLAHVSLQQCHSG